MIYRDIKALTDAIRKKTSSQDLFASNVLDMKDEEFVSRIEAEIARGKQLWSYDDGNKLMFIYRRMYQ